MRGLKILFLILLLSGCSSQETPTETCQNSGGEWNECGSGCLGTGSEICTTVCVAQCECLAENDYSCPGGLTCRYIEGEIKGACR